MFFYRRVYLLDNPRCCWPMISYVVLSLWHTTVGLRSSIGYWMCGFNHEYSPPVSFPLSYTLQQRPRSSAWAVGTLPVHQLGLATYHPLALRYSYQKYTCSHCEKAKLFAKLLFCVPAPPPCPTWDIYRCRAISGRLRRRPQRGFRRPAMVHPDA